MIEEMLYSHLSTTTSVTSLVSDRIYPVYMPQDPTLPCITYQRIANAPPNTLDGHPGLDHPIIQIDCWTTAYSAAKALGDALRKAMGTPAGFKALQLSDQDIYETETEIYRVSMDYSCWTKST